LHLSVVRGRFMSFKNLSISILFILAIPVWAKHSQKHRVHKSTVKHSKVYNHRDSEYKKAVAESQIKKMAKMIYKVEKSVDEDRALRLARYIYFQSQKHKLDPKIIIAIIDTESDFRQEAESSTGDLSLAQINPDVWVKEFVRLNKGGLDIERLKIDEAYAIDRMAEILHILKDRFAKNDPHWYARYHSMTKKFKRLYKNKVKRKIASILRPSRKTYSQIIAQNKAQKN